MKRKVKFQEGGAVDEPSPRSRMLRERMEKFRREGTRVQAAERARDRQVAEREATRATRIPPSPRASSVTPVDSLPPRGIPEPPRPSTVSPVGSAPVTRSMAGAVGRRALGPAGALIPDDSLRAGAEFERENLPRARLDAMRAALPERPDEATEMMNALPARPNVEAERRAAAPARRPAPARQGISADRLNELAMGAEPMNAEESMAQMRMQGRRRELEDRGSAFKKGGMVKKKAGGMIAAKPKKAAPKKPMPFKKGGVIKKKAGGMIGKMKGKK